MAQQLAQHVWSFLSLREPVVLGHIVDVATVAIVAAALTVAIAMLIAIKASSQVSTCFSGCDALNFRMAAGSARPAAFGTRTNKHMLRISA